MGALPFARVALIELAEIAVPEVPVFGPEAVSTVVFLTTVDVIPDPHVLVAAALLESPP